MRINSYDIETFVGDKKEIVPYCICFLYKNNYYSVYYEENLDIIKKSIDLIFSLKLKKKNIFYIHNLNFDGILILSSLTENKSYKFTSFIRENSIYSIKIFKKDLEIEFKCSYKILPISLKNISENFNITNKLIFPYKFSKKENLNYVGKIPEYYYFNSKEDYEIFINSNNFSFFDFKKYSIEYCKKDVEIVSKFIKNINLILEDIKTDVTKTYSAPSLSLKIFKEKFNKKNIKLTQNSFIDKYIRDSYYGGRCEVYGNPLELEYIYHFDFSGMYSQCMLQKYCFGKYKINNNCKSIDQPGFYYIEYYSEINIPVLPHHSFINNKLVFTNGYNKGIYWHEEIILFLEMGGKIIKIHYSIEFENYDYIFEDFIEYFNKIRNKGSDYKTFAKLIINSLYGRLGMREVSSHSFFINKKDFDYYSRKYKILDFIEINEYLLIKIEICEKFKKEFKISKTKNNINIASSITSKARIKLYKAQQSVIEFKGRILYSDTDSVFASYKENVLDQKHGEIFWDSKKEDTYIKDAVFVSPKTYGIIYQNNKQIIKMKGYNKKDIDFYDLKKKFYDNEDIEFENLTFLRKCDFNLQNINIKKKFNLNNYDKRIFIDNKKETIPLYYRDFNYSF